MNERLAAFRAAGLRAAELQLEHQQPDGAFTWEGFPKDAYHKQAYSWGVAGYLGAAHRLLTWVKRNALLPDGQLRDYDGDVYRQAWFFQGAHRLGRFDLSYPVMSFLLSCAEVSAWCCQPIVLSSATRRSSARFPAASAAPPEALAVAIIRQRRSTWRWSSMPSRTASNMMLGRGPSAA